MCGIGGGISWQSQVFTSPEQRKAFALPLQFRGPDAEGFWEQELTSTQPQVSFLHKRLSIIDLSEGGNQPMMSATGHSVIVFNGEIYNYRELRGTLTDYPFRTHSDTEVLLAGYETWGLTQLLEKVRGMFAIAIYDLRKQTLFLARDPFGKKPLYYHNHQKSLYFSSDIRSFSELSYTLSLNEHSVGYFFSELSTPMSHSIWQEVHKLPPGHFAAFSLRGWELHQYWKISFGQETTPLSRPQILETIDALLTQSVKRRQVADVSIGILLSGGIDSSLVVAKMASLSTTPINTYSVGFTDKTANELPYAKLVSEKYHTHHTELMVGPDDLLSIDDLILEYGEPFADLSMVPTYLISKQVSQQHKVILGGDGGDELFAGYYAHFFTEKVIRYQKGKHLLPLLRLSNQIYANYHTQLLQQVWEQAYKPSHSLLHRHMGIPGNWLSKIAPESHALHNATDVEHKLIWDSYEADLPTLSHLMSAGLHTRLVNDYLVKVDRASMYCSLEMRSPFLDQDLAEFAATIPWKQLFTPYGTKSILRELALQYLPRSLVTREKQGFSVPAKEWFQRSVGNRWKEVVLGGKQNVLPLDYSAVEDYFRHHQQATVDHTLGLWALYVFHVWAQNQ